MQGYPVVMDTTTKSLGYVVCALRGDDDRPALPSFPDVRQTKEDAAADRERAKRVAEASRDDARFVVAELREVE
jgi:hypothetical protein